MLFTLDIFQDDIFWLNDKQSENILLILIVVPVVLIDQLLNPVPEIPSPNPLLNNEQPLNIPVKSPHLETFQLETSWLNDVQFKNVLSKLKIFETSQEFILLIVVIELQLANVYSKP